MEIAFTSATVHNPRLLARNGGVKLAWTRTNEGVFAKAVTTFSRRKCFMVPPVMVPALS